MLLNISEDRLANGIRVASVRMPNVETVTMGVWVGVGGRYETKAVSGISHFIEHLLFKGTKSKSAKEISQAIEGRGGYFNAFTQEESTCYYIRISADHAWSGLEILCDMYLHPRFAADDIDRERGVIIEEIMMHKDHPQWLVQEVLGELLWHAHPLGRPLVGTVDTIRGMKRRDILAFKGSKYAPDNTVVVLAGKVEHDEVMKRVGDLLKGVPKAKGPRFPRISRKTAQKDVAVISKEIEQTHIAMGVRLFGRHDPRRYALKVLSIILGENMSSRLFQVVREKHGLAYSIHSSVQLYDDTGVLDVQAGVDRRRVGKALDLMLRETARLREKPVNRRELKRAKDYARGQLQIGLESSSNQMMWVGENLTCYRRLIQPAEVMRRIDRVTEKDVMRVAQDVLQRRHLSVAMVTPGEAASFTDLVRKSLPSAL